MGGVKVSGEMGGVKVRGGRGQGGGGVKVRVTCNLYILLSIL